MSVFLRAGKNQKKRSEELGEYQGYVVRGMRGKSNGSFQEVLGYERAIKIRFSSFIMIHEHPIQSCAT